MAGKRYKGKDCAYCGGHGISTEGDHVVARAFFFEEDRDCLPQVPSCESCNNTKSALEHYASAALMAGTNHIEGNRYRQEMVRPRLRKNRKLERDLGIADNRAVWMNVNGVIQPMHQIRVDAQKLRQLVAYVARGLYHHHIGYPLEADFWPDVEMKHPDHEPATWASVAEYFPVGSPRFGANLGRGSFVYEGAQSPAHKSFSVWRMAWHGVRLHGENTPPQGVGTWWAITRPTEKAVADAESRLTT